VTAEAVPRVDVLGVGISAVNMDKAIDVIKSWVDTGERQYVCVTGVHGVMESQKDPTLMAIHNGSGLVTPDGMPMVWAAHWAGQSSVERVYGPDLMIRLSMEAANLGWRVFLYGGKPGVPERLESRLSARISGLNIVGAHSPPFRSLSETERAEEREIINRARPDLVWVGLSTPKQEKWMAANVAHLSAKVLIGVGAAFDIHAGLSTQAPPWMRRVGLEWLFRLSREPRRLWRRYLYNNPRFVARILMRPPRVWTDAIGTPGIR
jgi:N-acetylglucosaminyldiphosphoundecaprenol N-acetyl-beta-D-mannosaminyltransferase